MKKVKPKLKKKSIIAVNLFLITALMVTSVFAWFAVNADNRVDGYEILVQSDSTLELSFDTENWTNNLNLADLVVDASTGSQTTVNTSRNVLENLNFVEVTGDGIADGGFLKPQLIQHGTYATVNTSFDACTAAVKNTDFLSFTVYMRSKEPLNVYLSSDSYAAPASKDVGADCGNPISSSYVSSDSNLFSKDCVVGALRVGYESVPEGNAAGLNNKVWITNPNYHLNNNVGVASGYTMTTNATSGSNSTNTGADNTGVGQNGDPFYWNDSYTHYYYSKYIDDNNVNRIGIVTFNGVLTSLPDSIANEPDGQTTRVAKMDGTPDNDGYYTGNVTFRVWIEGCDTEARRALVGGKFNLSLVLDAFAITT